MKALQFMVASMWIIVMWIISTSNTEFFLTFATAMMFVVIWSIGGDGNGEPIKARKILIKYRDGNKEEATGTEWERWDDHISVYNNELEDNLIKEVNADCVKSIGFVLTRKNE